MKAAVLQQRNSPLAIGIGVLIAFSALGMASPVYSSDWGCRVLLCLANPAGPEAVAECVPPIEALWAALRKRNPDPFPTCDLATGPNGSSYALQGYSYYDTCPSGTTALDAGAYAILDTTLAANPLAWLYGTQLAYAGIGSGDGLTWDPSLPPPQKVCVGQVISSAWTTVVDSNGYSNTILAPVYDQVALLDPAASPSIIDVFIDNQLFHRVRW